MNGQATDPKWTPHPNPSAAPPIVPKPRDKAKRIKREKVEK